MILAVNTSTIQFSVALMGEDGTVQAEHLISGGSKNFGGFMPAIDFLLTISKFSIQDTKALIVATGPGSFTGLRVGLSTVKGICQGLQIPVIGVSSLEAMANQLPYTCYPICSIMDSRKGEVFAALFNWSGERRLSRIQEDTCLRLTDLPSMIQGETIFLGNNFNTQAPLISGMLGQKALPAPAHFWNLRASAVGTLGLERFQNNDFDNLEDLVPSYLRSPDIRPNPYPLIPEEPPNSPRATIT